ncbi:MAG: penicillin-binding protein 1A [Rhodospirillaceae bacterium]|nr:penicillin-binding protein 1A [Rhodospirillaceae bacterium]MBT6203925.1 penicillin-binding protein 1A [Rhodospirillaceae bacterium]MBT7611877.1 penicillin-binding protein 1A [Rhodospirillaceae bacterium]
MRILLVLIALGFLGAIAAGGVVVYAFYHYGTDLPDHRMLADYEPPVATRIYAGDGSLMAEFAVENRVFVPIEAIPAVVRNAFIAAEDQNFYEHRGVDPIGIMRAAITNLQALGAGRRLQGASTITQQVAKNFLLTNEVSYERKIKEAILAFRIEDALSKDRILELYLNEIYLGFGSYGVAAAALNYFNKPLDEVTLAEAAYLAALPKAPNNYHPVNKTENAIERRNWVIVRMVEEGYAATEEALIAQNQTLGVDLTGAREPVVAAYATEEIRREIAELYGSDALYEGGLYVRSTIDPTLQDAARRALRAGLSAYDRRHGWRGPLASMVLDADWAQNLASLILPEDLAPWRIAAVLGMNEDAVVIGFSDGVNGLILLEDMTWARAQLEDGGLGGSVGRPSDALAVGDVILVEQLAEDEERDVPEGAPIYALRQFPDVSGGIIAMDPHTGRILAMEGGFSFDDSEFNRATQAMRQPGSAFKPFVYLAALDHGFTPATLIEDAPFVYDPGEGQDIWKPANYSEVFYGPTPLRIGIEKSRNLMTVRLANIVGPQVVADYAAIFGVLDEGLPFYLPMALGAAETTLLRMTTGYAMIVNGGKRIEPALIERIQDRDGMTIWRRDERLCDACDSDAWNDAMEVPLLPDLREQVVEPQTAYQIVHIMEGVVQRGTGVRLRELARPLAGKTGTTNDNRDAWFMGFSPDLAVGVYVGFDQPETLGKRETGSSVAIPVWKAFITEALEHEPIIPFRIPPDIRLVRIDGDRGLLPGAVTERIITEAFRPGTEPTETADSYVISADDVIDGSDVSISEVY